MQFVKSLFVLGWTVISLNCLPNDFGQKFKLPIGTPLFGDSIENGSKNEHGRQGLWQSFNPDSHRLTKTSHYQNDQLHGKYTEFDLLGRLHYQVDYVQGVKHGWEYKRKRDGEVSRCQINQGILDGPCYRSREGQTEYLSGTYIKGIKQGAFICYHKDGRIKVKGRYQDGKQEGIWIITPRDPDNHEGYKNYHYVAGKRIKIVYPKTGKVDNNPSQVKFHSKNKDY